MGVCVRHRANGITLQGLWNCGSMELNCAAPDLVRPGGNKTGTQELIR